ncbi:hypothetical protein [Phaeobacter sp. 11ANDIMAR09]|uniref:plasmid mobilization protein n=1 Tax=Phaeobacter sp. 11ANDIMAR09 TaxID=1225647 RepID=UPI0006C87BEF|nr:hypothetical protein [Phaeobacter sp. 11ANDIMAR09]KPD10368.1 hypothetical protein AN476_21360 [Phaeobacter sp. 11ANDIMAR09]
MTKRTEDFKIWLTPEEADKIKNHAHDQRISKADYARFLIFGPGSCKRLPSAVELKKIAFLLATISGNLNQCQRSINAAQLAGTLDSNQFAAMHKAIAFGHSSWSKPLSEFRSQLDRLKPDVTV